MGKERKEMKGDESIAKLSYHAFTARKYSTCSVQYPSINPLISNHESSKRKYTQSLFLSLFLSTHTAWPMLSKQVSHTLYPASLLTTHLL